MIPIGPKDTVGGKIGRGRPLTLGFEIGVEGTLNGGRGPGPPLTLGFEIGVEGTLNGGRGPGPLLMLGFEIGVEGTLNGGRGTGPPLTLGFEIGVEGTLNGGRGPTDTLGSDGCELITLPDATREATEVSAFDTWLATELRIAVTWLGSADDTVLAAADTDCAIAMPKADTAGDTPAAVP